MTPSVTVVLCAFTMQRCDEVMDALRSVLGQQPPPDQVVVVIDHNDELLAWMRDEVTALGPAGGTVGVVPSEGPQGLSGARNTGVTQATGEVVAFLDDDAVAEPGWLAALLSPYADPAVVAVGGWVEPLWEGERPAWFPDEFGWVVGCSYRGLPESLAPIRNPIGANMSFRRDALDLAGGFSARVGRTGSDGRGDEETELSIRVLRALPGSRILLQPTARVRHHVPESRATWQYFRHRCYAEGLSKALISDLVGVQSALASERAYVRSTLPHGFIAAVGESVRSRDPARLAPAAAIVGGLTATTAGYAVGWGRQARSARTRP